MPNDDIDDLMTVNGIQVDGESLEIQVGFDGETVTFRSEEGNLEEMGLLCYLHYVLIKHIEEMTDEDGNELDPDGITPGHVISHLIQYLHEQHHQLAAHNRMAALARMMSGSGEESSEENGVTMFKFGENGLEPITEEELADTIKNLRDDEVLAEVKENADDDDDDDDEYEIIVHGSPDDPPRHH